MEYKDNREKTIQSPKPQYTKISLSHKREITTKEKYSLFPYAFVATKERNNKRFIGGCFLPLVTIETTDKERHLKPCGFSLKRCSSLYIQRLCL
jgi:hypothetical protein